MILIMNRIDTERAETVPGQQDFDTVIKSLEEAQAALIRLMNTYPQLAPNLHDKCLEISGIGSRVSNMPDNIRRFQL